MKKTRIISFTKSRKWDFPPIPKFRDGTLIETETKLLVLSDNLWEGKAENMDAKTAGIVVPGWIIYLLCLY